METASSLKRPEHITVYIQHRPDEPWHIHQNYHQRAACGRIAIRYIATATPPRDTVPTDICQRCRELFGMKQLELLNTNAPDHPTRKRGYSR